MPLDAPVTSATQPASGAPGPTAPAFAVISGFSGLSGFSAFPAVLAVLAVLALSAFVPVGPMAAACTRWLRTASRHGRERCGMQPPPVLRKVEGRGVQRAEVASHRELS
ncbi:hypothetical protein GCM10010211_50580 [Streptomyces albospinus]|uniref:Uncharacterized protein n=1 Tax=Streptomyces albospinus TaxID=285515 RepID=A0ABQ2VBG8_9ACTN|nr:hypothetical protein GCM10010211_50580 [Streptomyces albospinus]